MPVFTLYREAKFGIKGSVGGSDIEELKCLISCNEMWVDGHNDEPGYAG